MTSSCVITHIFPRTCEFTGVSPVRSTP
ncbi:hypothetical protein FQN60_013303 [Etheostoma spectabile]|uniref:Uncharacterized protein n=1 Tax=Etheostoma spectabile TaxID=54343 RepID=A0A5J5D5E8_9PERO|nr:hypothetical protein FQN60_013303 [Etheostoma spectabile]